MNNQIAQEWFEMADLRKRRFSTAVWVPLRAIERTVFEDGREEFFGCGCLAVNLPDRPKAAHLKWMQIGIAHEAGPYAFRDGRYKISESYLGDNDEQIGVDMIFDQRIGHGYQSIWHINQDIILALKLVKEGNSWVAPDEDYCEVIREKIDENGKFLKIEIKQEFLCDYLCARGLALKLVYYRQRLAKIDDVSHIAWAAKGNDEESEGERFSLRVLSMTKDGSFWGEGAAVFRAWRTDVDVEEDVPVFGPTTSENSDGNSSIIKPHGQRINHVEGELWREEWIEPSARSLRVRGDSPEEDLLFIVDASGTKEKASLLDNEDIGRYLWFDPKVISALSQRRGGSLEWYTRQTGDVRCSKDYRVWFGINAIGLITVYAHDVARLPLWQQRIWAGFNIAPNGGVSVELLQAQMETRPANTKAPESLIVDSIAVLNSASVNWIGKPLFRKHDAADAILKVTHRFRALEPDGIYALAKDLVRLVIEQIETKHLQQVAVPPKGEKWGSIKSLENALSTLIPKSDARNKVAVLALIYELRKTDSHLPSSTSDKALADLGLELGRFGSAVEQGEVIIGKTIVALFSIADAIDASLRKQ